MNTYSISKKSAAGDIVGTVQAPSYNAAAQAALKLLFPGRRPLNLVAQRVTGDHKLSGWFQAYYPIRGGGLTSHGEQFHVS